MAHRSLLIDVIISTSVGLNEPLTLAHNQTAKLFPVICWWNPHFPVLKIPSEFVWHGSYSSTPNSNGFSSFSHQNHHLSQIHHLSWNHHLFHFKIIIFPYISIHVHTFLMEKRCDFALMALRRSSKSRQLRVPKRRLPRRAKTTREAWPGLGPWDPQPWFSWVKDGTVPFWRILEDHQKWWKSRWNVVKKTQPNPGDWKSPFRGYRWTGHFSFFGDVLE